MRENRPFPFWTPRKEAARRQLYTQLLGSESVATPEDFPEELPIPLAALGDVERSVRRSYETELEQSFFTQWSSRRGFRPSRVYEGRPLSESFRGLMARTMHSALHFVPLHYHTHPDPVLLQEEGERDFFSTNDVNGAIFGHPFSLVATYGGIFMTVASDKVMRPRSEWDETQKAALAEAEDGYIHTPWERARQAHDMGFAVYFWEIPTGVTSDDFRQNWERYFQTMQSQGRDTFPSSLPFRKITSFPTPN